MSTEDEIRQELLLQQCDDKIKRMCERIEKLEQQARAFEIDRSRWIGGVVVLSVLGALVTWFLNAIATIKGIK